MKNIEGFVFFDKSLYTFHDQMPIFGAGENFTFSLFQTNLKAFSTPQKAAKIAKRYYQKFETRNPFPVISELKMNIPESIEEEENFLKESGLIIIVPQDSKNSVKLIGAPTTNRTMRYCNDEIRASELNYNKITPYYPMTGETAYTIASEARDEIARQSCQTGIFIAKFSLERCPNSLKLIYYS